MKASNLACNSGTVLPTKSYYVGISLRCGVQGTVSVDITRSSMDAPFMIERYAESLLHNTFEEYVCTNEYYKLVISNWQRHVALLHARCIYEPMPWSTYMCVSRFMCV